MAFGGELQLVKRFSGGLHASEVALYRTPKGESIVKKRYDLRRAKPRESFLRELAVLQRLTALQCDIAPKLLHANQEAGEMYMSFCGGRARNTRINRMALHAARMRLANEFGVQFNTGRKSRYRKICEWIREGGGRYLHNVTLMPQADGTTRLCCIDFGARSVALLPLPAQAQPAPLDISATLPSKPQPAPLDVPSLPSKPPAAVPVGMPSVPANAAV